MTVIVEIGLEQIQATPLGVQAPVGRHILETTLSIIAERLHGLAGVPGRADQIEKAIAIEVVHDGAARQVESADPETGGDIGPVGKVAS